MTATATTRNGSTTSRSMSSTRSHTATSSKKHSSSRISVTSTSTLFTSSSSWRFVLIIFALTFIALLKLEEERLRQSTLTTLDKSILPAYHRVLNATKEHHKQQLQQRTRTALRRSNTIKTTTGGSSNNSNQQNNQQQQQNQDDSFGICLMIKDDNHFLVEWIAYNWFVLPLKHLIVMIDSSSQTSPLPIFDRWNDRIKIDVVNWTYPNSITKPRPHLKKNSIWDSVVHRKHMAKQLNFYQDCIKTFKRQQQSSKGGPSHVLLVDTDEFISINPRVRDPNHHELYRGGHSNNVVLSNDEYGSVMKMLKQQQNPPCQTIHRMQICVDEANSTTTTDNAIPSGFNHRDFLTTRYLLAESPRRGKNLIHLDSLSSDYINNLDLIENMASVHYVLPDKCSQIDDSKIKKNQPPPYDRDIFQIYHYSGSIEQQQYRIDPRGKFGSKTRAGTKPVKPGQCSPNNNIPANDVRSWLKGFVNKVGPKEAQRLLEGSGRIHSWPSYNNNNNKNERGGAIS